MLATSRQRNRLKTINLLLTDRKYRNSTQYFERKSSSFFLILHFSRRFLRICQLFYWELFLIDMFTSSLMMPMLSWSICPSWKLATSPFLKGSCTAAMLPALEKRSRDYRKLSHNLAVIYRSRTDYVTGTCRMYHFRVFDQRRRVHLWKQCVNALSQVIAYYLINSHCWMPLVPSHTYRYHMRNGSEKKLELTTRNAKILEICQTKDQIKIMNWKTDDTFTETDSDKAN